MNKRMRKAILCVILSGLLVAFLSGCGEKPTAEVEESAVEESTEQDEEVVSVDDTAEETEEAEVDVFKETVEPWLIETGTQGIQMAVWNEENNTMRVIGEDENYTRVEGDRFFLCTPSFLIGFSTHSSIDSASFCSMQIEEPQDNYCEVTFAKAETGVNELSIEDIGCKDGEAGEVRFNLVEEGYVAEEVITIPDDLEQYLKDGTGENILGFNLPEDYSVEFVSGAMASLYSNSNGDWLYLSTSPEMQDIYEGGTDIKASEYTDEEGNVETYNMTYTEMGTYETIYGVASLYEEITEVKKVDFETTLHSQIALLKVNGKFIEISYAYDSDDYPNPTHDITWVLQQLFE